MVTHACAPLLASWHHVKIEAGWARPPPCPKAPPLPEGPPCPSTFFVFHFLRLPLSSSSTFFLTFPRTTWRVYTFPIAFACSLPLLVSDWNLFEAWGMASTSASRGDAGAARIATATTTLSTDFHAIVAEIRRGLSVIKSIAVDLEKENHSEMVKQLEDSVLELLVASEDCTTYSKAVEAVGNGYQPQEELTDFKKLLEDEVTKLKRETPAAPLSNPFLRQFKEAIWNVHHAGQPMPGEEQEDIVMTSTQSNLLNITCPLSGKPVTQLESPVRSVDCKHIYEKMAVMHYIVSKKPTPRCPVAGCPKILVPERVICDSFLPIEIEEMRSRENTQATVLADFTELDE
ncbi:hypothetical protein H6P81_013905 [Aristolochia fimbriata]|uniref:SP-RING-type domain-containing protein n=1 Tax=Aristolochia fimbriata TaxID=158543 RepID=A0AAV7EJM5_ARIFI|nr:hypothetical protein H6P81_013905 [Aristolochia fimbriata]